jgi:dTDP-4-dehydrorhamnose reductase
VRILILGTSGFLGKTLYKVLKKNKYSIFHTGLLKKKKNLTNINNLIRIIFSSKPNLIINCCGLTNIDRCEEESKLSKKINLEIIKNIFFIKKNYNLSYQLIHFSTDQVYNPKKNIKNKENSFYKPINIYSTHKLLAEQICLKNTAIVFRLNLIGKSIAKKESFTDWIYKNIKKNKKINGFTDSYYSPLSAETVSKIINKIIKKNQLDNTGIYNLGSTNGISKINLIKKFSSKLKIFNEKLIIKEKINNICKTIRTRNNRLCVKKFEKKFKIKLPNILLEIKRIVKDYE